MLLFKQVEEKKKKKKEAKWKTIELFLYQKKK